jgi:hypothetical protein
VVVFQPVLDFAGDRFQVRLRGAGADDKVIREARDALKIQDYDLLRLFVRREFGAGFG